MAATAALQLRVHDRNVWVASPNTLNRYDWDSGNPAQEVALDSNFGNVVDLGDELLTVVEKANGQRIVTHISLSTGQPRTEEFGAVGRAAG